LFELHYVSCVLVHVKCWCIRRFSVMSQNGVCILIRNNVRGVMTYIIHSPEAFLHNDNRRLVQRWSRTTFMDLPFAGPSDHMRCLVQRWSRNTFMDLPCAFPRYNIL
jgi:hypothetical protein